MAKPLTPGEIEIELQARAYSQGFAIGANPLASAKRHTVEFDTHHHWRQGFEDGRKASDVAAASYKEKLRAQNPKTG